MNETNILTLQTGEGSSETTRSASPIETINNEYKFFLKLVSWAAISKAGYISCEVTMHTKEVQTCTFSKPPKIRAFQKKNLYSVDRRIVYHSSSFR